MQDGEGVAVQPTGLEVSVVRGAEVGECGVGVGILEGPDFLQGLGVVLLLGGGFCCLIGLDFVGGAQPRVLVQACGDGN